MPNKNSDITNKQDVIVMVNSFYEKVKGDDLLSPVFNDFAKVDWETHLPRMYDFWNTLIFGEGSYKGNPFAAHVPLPVQQQHFEQWVKLFEQNIDEHFIGEVAEHTKLRAKSIAHIFQSKLEFLNQRK